MNIVEVQDSLKNFSQDQLISEINQPSGMVPQFLVLTELGRRNRIKQDMEGRQAQNQPTVAQEVVSAAGVPQGGIMDMARSMAPKSSIEQNDAVKMMAEGGVVKMQQGTVVYNGKTYFTDGTYVAEKGASGRIVPVNDPDIVEAVTNKSPIVQSNVEGIKNISTNVEDFAPNIPFSTTADPELDMSALDPVLGIRPEMIPQFPDQGNPLFSIDKDTQKAVSEIAEPTGRQSLDGRMVSTVGPTADEIERAQKVLEMNPVTASDEELELLGSRLNFLNRDPEEDSDLFPVKSKRKNRNKNEIKEQADSNTSGRNDPKRADQDRSSFIVDVFNEFTNPKSRKDRLAEQEIKDRFGLETEDIPISDIPNFDGATIDQASQDIPDELQMPEFNNTPKDPNTDPDPDPDSSSSLNSVESEILNMLRENEDQQEKDKYLALAKAGLALMASDQPTFGGALGEAGMAGIEDLQASRRAYRDDKITLLDAQRKLEQARATAAAKDKSGLTATNIVSTLNNIRNQKSKIMTKLAEITPAIDGGELTEAQKNQAEMLKREIANLTVMESTYAGMLGGIGSLGATGTFDATEE